LGSFPLEGKARKGYFGSRGSVWDAHGGGFPFEIWHDPDVVVDLPHIRPDLSGIDQVGGQQIKADFSVRVLKDIPLFH